MVVDAARTGISTVQIVAYVALAAGLSATGNLIIKNAARSMGGFNLSGGHLAQTLFHLFTNAGIILGLALYLVGFVLWAKVLSTVDISLAYPIFVSLAFVIVVVGSRIFFYTGAGFQSFGYDPDFGGWYDGEPSPAVGQGFYIFNNSTAKNWIRHFSVGP